MRRTRCVAKNNLDILMWLAFVQAIFVLTNEPGQQVIFFIILYALQDCGTVVDDSGILIEWKFFIHFPAGKMTG